MYGLARQESLPPSTSLMVAVSTTYSHKVFFGVVWNIGFLYAAAWTPMILLCLCRATAESGMRRRTGWLIVGGLLYGLQILAGIGQVPIYATFAYVLYVVLRISLPWRLGLPTRDTVRQYSGWAARMLLFGILGAMVAGALILPAAELFGLSARAPEHFAHFDRAVGGVDHSLWRRLSLLVHSFWGEPDFASARLLGAMLSGEYFSLNIGLLIAAAAAVFARAKLRVVVYGSLLYLLLDLCVGSPMPIARLFAALPAMTSASSYASILLVIPLGILAGLGVEELFSRVSNRTLPKRIVLYLAGTGSLLIAFLPEPAGGGREWSFLWALLPSSVLISMTLLSKFRHYRHLVLSLMVLETAVCSLSIAESLFVPRPLSLTVEELSRLPSRVPGRARSVSLSHNDNLWSLRRAVNGYDPMILAATSRVLSNPGEENVYSRYLQLQRNLAAVAFLKRPFWLVSAVVPGGLPDDKSLFPPARVVFLNDAPQTSLQELVIGDVLGTTIAEPRVEKILFSEGAARKLTFSNVSLPRRNSALFVDYTSLERSRFVLRVQGHGDRELVHFKYVAAAATGHETATIEFPLPDFTEVDIEVEILGKNAPALDRVSIVSDLRDESDLIHVLHDTPDRVVIEVRDAPGPRALVYTDSAYPGWRAFVDDVAVPIHRANDAYKAVLVPSGTHEIRFEFRPWRVRVGVGVSIAAAGAGLFSLPWCFRRSRESASE